MTTDASESEAVAFLRAQQAFRPAVKDSENPHFKSKFVSLQGVIDAALDALHEHGFALIQPTRIGDDGRTIVVTTLLHVSGRKITSEYPVTASQAGPQGEGSGLTYARRYALMSLLGIAPEDDDGNAATGPARPARAARAEAKPDFPKQIKAASNADDLGKVGAAIAAAEMDAAERTALRASFSARMTELRG